jgi:MFS family permease
VFAAMNVLVGPIETVFLPVYADQVFASALRYGLMAAAVGAGALTGTLLFGTIGHRMPRRAVFLGGYLTVPLVVLALAPTPGLPVTLGLLTLLGLALGLIDPLEYTIYFERIPENMRARVLGIIGALGWCTVPLGRVGGGVLIDRLGLSTTLALAGALFVVVPLVALSRPIFRCLGPPLTPTDRQATPLEMTHPLG